MHASATPGAWLVLPGSLAVKSPPSVSRTVQPHISCSGAAQRVALRLAHFEPFAECDCRIDRPEMELRTRPGRCSEAVVDVGLRASGKSSIACVLRLSRTKEQALQRLFCDPR